jgi:hypothetical protein
MVSKNIICRQCNSSFLVEWRKAKWPVVHSIICPTCEAELYIRGSLPMRIHRVNPKGNWQFVGTAGK